MRARGESHGRAKMTAASVASLMVDRENGATIYGLAKRYGISRRQVKRIITGQQWMVAR